MASRLPMELKLSEMWMPYQASLRSKITYIVSGLKKAGDV